MFDQSRVIEILMRWEESHDAGRCISPEDLCKDSPELLGAVRDGIARLQKAARLLEASMVRTQREAAEAFRESPSHDTPIDGNHDSPTKSPQIPGYEILGELGRGGMGVVYRAKHLRLNRIVALKMILGGGHASAADMSRFLSEAQAVASLQHPHIVQIFETGEHGGLPYFTLEFMAGGSLAAKVATNPLPPRDAAMIVEQLARGMNYAHTQGVVHRDLKPENVMLSADGTPKITDFGLAKSIEAGSSLTQSGAVMGTPSYMAPEQARGETKAVGPLADVYALGAVLYRLVTGRPPFQAATLLDTIQQVVNDEPVQPSRLMSQTPKDLETICLKCLRKEPHQRYRNALELAEDLGRFLRHEPITARPVSAIERAWRWAKRNPGRSSLIGALAASIIVALAGMTILWLRADHRERLANFNAEQAKEQKRLADEKAEIARQQEEIALAEAAKSLQLAKFMTDVFEAPDPLGFHAASSHTPERLGDTMTARKLLQRGLENLERQRDLPEDVRAALLDRVGSVCLILGQFKTAEKPLKEALAIRRRLLPADHIDLAQSKYHVGWALQGLGDYQQCETLYREALSALQDEKRDVALERANVHFRLGWLYIETEEHPKAEAAFQEALAIRKKYLGPQAREVAMIHIALAACQFDAQKEIPAALNGYSGVTILMKQANSDHLAQIAKCFFDSVLAANSGDMRGAERHVLRGINLMHTSLGADHPYLILFYAQLAVIRHLMGKIDDAESSFQDAIRIWKQEVGLAHPQIPRLALYYGFLQIDRRDIKRGLAFFDEVLVAIEQRFGRQHPIAANTLVCMNIVRQRAGIGADLDSIQEALRIFEARHQTHSRYYYVGLAMNGDAYAARRDFVTAEKWLQRALEGYQRSFKGFESEYINILQDLVDVQQAQGKAAAEVDRNIKELERLTKPPLVSIRPPAVEYGWTLFRRARHLQLNGELHAIPDVLRPILKTFSNNRRFLIDAADWFFYCHREAARTRGSSGARVRYEQDCLRDAGEALRLATLAGWSVDKSNVRPATFDYARSLSDLPAPLMRMLAETLPKPRDSVR